MEFTETRIPTDHSAGADRATGEPSVASALEHLVAGSQGVITKRIDLALLEGQELLSRTLQRVALAGVGVVVAAAAWFAMVACCVLLVTPHATLVVRLATFGLINGAGAVGLVTLAMRHSRPLTRVRANGNGPTLQREPLPDEGKH